MDADTEVMRVLTVQQPWAWCIFHGKDVENRTQAFKYRGPLAIHAGARLSERGCQVIPDLLDAHEPDETLRAYAEADLPYSAVIGVVDLVGVHEAEPGCCDSPWAEQSNHHTPRCTHLLLENPREFTTPIADVKGSLGLWKPDLRLNVLIEERLT